MSPVQNVTYVSGRTHSDFNPFSIRVYVFEHLFTLTSRNVISLVVQQFLRVRNPHKYYIVYNRSLDEIYEAICNRIQERYAKQGIEISDEEVRKAADNLIRFCNRVMEIEMTEEEG